MHELHSYVWAYADEQKALGMEVEPNIKLSGATNPNIETIRKSIIPTQLCQVKSNVGYDTDFGVFEIGRVVEGMDENNLCIEKKKLALTLYSKTKGIKALYFELRDILATVADDLKHKPLSFKVKEAAHSYEHPVNLYEIELDGKSIGEIGIVHPVVSKKIDKKADIVFAEVDMEAFANVENASITYSEPSKFPPMTYDISVELPDGTFFSNLAKCWEGLGGDILRNISIVDTYDTELIHSITIRFEFVSNERTLESSEVQAIMDKVIENLSNINVKLRS